MTIDDIAWPDPTSAGTGTGPDEAKLELFKAQLVHAREVAAFRRQRKKDADDANARRTAADIANEHQTYQAVYNSYIEVAKAGIDRAFQRAAFIQTVTTAIGSLYTGVLALSFSGSPNGNPLPSSGLAAGIFLAVSFMLSAAYVGFVTKPEDIVHDSYDGTLHSGQDARRNTFIRWVRNSVYEKIALLRASVVSLGVSIGFLPTPYLNVSSTWLWKAVFVGLILVIFVASWDFLVKNVWKKMHL